MVLLNPRPDEKEIIKYYQSPDYDPHAVNRKGWFHRFYHWVQLWAFSQKRKHLMKWVSSPGKLLDIGGGKGDFCKYMKDRGWETVLYEPGTSAVSVARQRRLRILKSLESATENPEKFDVITMWHSLEHIHRTDSLFASIRSCLKNNGILAISVPNLNAPEEKSLKDTWAPYDAPRHLYHFTPETLSEYLKKQGFTIVKTYSLFQDTPYNILLSVKEKTFSSLFKMCMLVISSWVTTLIKGPSYSSSMEVICKRS